MKTRVPLHHMVLCSMLIASGCGGGGGGGESTTAPPPSGGPPISQEPPPTAAEADLAVTPADQSVLIPVLANDDLPTAGLRLVDATGAQHGQLEISGDSIRYTPQAGFVGEDRFAYTSRHPDGSAMRGDVTVGVGAGAQIELRGMVVDSPIRNARVRVTLNDFNFDAWSDAQGAYALRVASLTGAGFVIAHAAGASDSGADVDFRSVLGDFRRLAEEAGADGLLVAAESAQVNITNLSTAQYVLMTQINAGDPPQNDEELRALSQALDIDRIFELAAIIHLVIDEGVALPTGVDNVLALVSDANAVAAFKASLAEEVLEEAFAEVSAASFLPQFTADDLSAVYALIAPGAPGTINVGLSYLLEFDGVESDATAGSGRVMQYQPDASPEATWLIDEEGQLRITSISPPVTVLLEEDEDCASGARTAEYAVHELAARRLFDGVGSDQVLLTQVARTTFPDEQGCPAREPTTETVQSFALMIELSGVSSGELPFDSAPSQFGLSVYQPEIWTLDPWGYELYDFASTPSSPLTWELRNGRFYVNQPENRPTEYIRLQTDGAAGHGVLAIATLEDGARVVNYGVSVARDSEFAFSEQNLAALWRSGFDLSQFAGDGAPDTGFFVRLDAGGLGRHELVDGAGVCLGTHPHLSWRVESGDMIADRITGLSGYRRWTPLARAGSRIYVIEVIGIEPGTPFEVADRRPNFYEPQSTPSACGTP